MDTPTAKLGEGWPLKPHYTAGDVAAIDFAREVNDREGFLADLFATHPPIKRRIMLLSAMAYQETVTSPGRPPESSAGQPQRMPSGTP